MGKRRDFKCICYKVGIKAKSSEIADDFFYTMGVAIANFFCSKTVFSSSNLRQYLLLFMNNIEDLFKLDNLNHHQNLR